MRDAPPTSSSRRQANRYGDPEAGIVTAFVVIMILALLMVTGLIYDGGRVIVAKRQAIDVAEQAARAGAQAIDVPTLRAGRGFRLDPVQARQAARTYLAEVGEQGSVTVGHDADGDFVAVTVPYTVHSVLLTLVGIRELDGSGHASAHNCEGVVREETC